MTANEIDSYVSLFKQIREKVATDEIASLLLEQMKKDQRVAIMYSRQNGNLNGKPDEPASWKQLRYLSNLGVQLDNSKQITKKEAATLIEQALGR